jgi:O-antigen/teichoic acid export membrane protein
VRRGMVVGAGVNLVALMAVLVVSFFLAPQLIGSLGKPRYDVWCVVESVLAYFTLLDLGIAAGLVRVVARGRVTSDVSSINTYASASLVIFSGAGLIVLGVGGPILLAMAPRLAENAPDVVPFMLVMFFNLALTLPLSLFPAILDGLECFTVKGLIRLGMLAIRTTAILAYLQSDAGLWPLSIIITVTNLTEHGLMVILSFWLCPGLRLQPWAVKREMLRTVRSESFDAFLAMLAGRMTLQTGAILIGLMLPVGQATFFAMAVRLVESAKQLLRQITTTLTPGVSAMHAQGDDAGIRQLLLKGTRWVLYLAVPVNIGLWWFGGVFLARWVGPEFTAGSGFAVNILAFTLALGLAQSVAARVLYGLGHLWWFARIAMLEGVINIMLTLVLIRPFGVNGVSVAVAVPNVLFCLFVVVHTLRLLRIPVGDYLRACAAPVILGVVPLVVWAMLGDVAVDWWVILAHGIAGVAAYAVLVAGWEMLGKEPHPRPLSQAERGASGLKSLMITKVRADLPLAPPLRIGEGAGG